MKAVILSAGKGTRMGKLTENLSKVMLPVNGKPLLEWHITHLKTFGITEFFINTHYNSKSITDYFQNGEQWGVHITYSYEKELQGTAGALKPFIKNLNERFIVLYGDVFTTVDITKFEKFHKQKHAAMTIVVHPTNHPQDSDLILMDNTMKVTKMYCKPHNKVPSTNLSLAALYIMEPTMLRHLPEKLPSDFERDFLVKILEKEKNIFCYNTNEFIQDIGTPSRYQHINDYLSNTSTH